MSGKDRPPRKDLLTSLRREIDDLKKQLERHEHVEKLHQDAIADVSKAIYRLDSFEDSAKVIFQACKRATGAKSGYLALLSPDGAESTILHLDTGGVPCIVDPSLPLPIRGLRAEAYKSKTPASDNNFTDSKWMQFIPSGHVTLKNVMIVPMIVGNEAKGLIGLANKPGGFTEEDAGIMMSYAEIAAIALANNKLKDAYQDASFLKDLLIHDINNVLQSISSAAEVSKLKISKGLPAASISESLGLIAANITRGGDLIKSIQKLEKLVDPKLAIKLQDIMRPLKEAIELVKKRFPSRQLEITIDSDEEGIILANILELIRDAFENILMNAIRHNTSSTVVIGIAICHVIDGDMPAIRLEFVDNGVGIEDERKVKIFDRGIYKPSSKEGLGIGLSVVKRIITRCGGKIWCEDAVKGDHTRGSKFIVVLPAATDPAAADDNS